MMITNQMIIKEFFKKSLNNNHQKVKILIKKLFKEEYKWLITYKKILKMCLTNFIKEQHIKINFRA